MATASAKTETKVTQNAAAKAEGLPDFSTWEKLQTGFPAYWQPTEKGQWIYGRLVAKEDATDVAGSFTRYLVQAGVPTKCLRGSKNDGNQREVEVPAGDYFTISVYYALQGQFDFMIEQNFMPTMRLEVGVKNKTKASRTVWDWELKVAPESKNKINMLQFEARKALAAERAAKELQASQDNDADEDFDPKKLEAKTA